MFLDDAGRHLRPAVSYPAGKERNMHIRAGIPALTAIAAAVLLASTALAATHRVPSAYATIQAAINACVAGDTVLVASGTYQGDGNRDLSFGGVDLVLASEAGAQSTIIDCGAEVRHRGLIFQHGETRASVVDGFTIQNGYHAGGGIRMEMYASPTIRNCILTNNVGWPNDVQGAFGGAAISEWGPGSPLIENCLITSNDGAQTGYGAVYLDNPAAAEINHCTLSSNVGGGQGGAISLSTTGSLTVRNCVIEGNEALVGGGIYGGSVTIENCEITRNQADDGGGVTLDQTSSITGSTIARNFADRLGGGALLVDCTVDRCILRENCSPSTSDLGAAGRVQLSCCAVSDSGVGIQGPGSITWTGPQVSGNPRFCDLPACPHFMDGPAGDYHLRSDSPCLAQFSPCHALIGYWDQGCSAPAPVGACCLSANTCILTTQADCAAQHGIYGGDGVPCFPTPCVPVPTKVMTWGKIKSTFR